MIGSLGMPLVAQCTGAAPCELPTGLPWYFGLPILVLWLGAVAGVLLLARRLLVRRMERRRLRSERLAIERVSKGAGLERW